MLQAPLGLADLLALREPQGPQERLDRQVLREPQERPEPQALPVPLAQTAQTAQTEPTAHKDLLGLLAPLEATEQMAQTVQMEPPRRLR